jgi:hypothetical protein
VYSVNMQQREDIEHLSCVLNVLTFVMVGSLQREFGINVMKTA